MTTRMASQTPGDAVTRALLSHASLPLAVVDASGTLCMANEAFQELLGVTFESVRMEHLADFFHLYAEDGVSALPVDQIPSVRAFRGETVRDAVVSVRTPGGAVRFLRCNADPLVDPDGRRQGAILHLVDATSERTAAAEQERLRQLLLETVNHEFRTPLTVVLASAELLDDMDLELPPEAHRMFSGLVREAHNMKDLLQTISRLVDLEAATYDERVETELAPLVHQAVAPHRSRAMERDLTLCIDVPAQLRATVNPVHLARAVDALVDNAVTYAPEGSQVEIGASEEEGTVSLVVADEGQGIRSADLERLKHPFERGNHPLQPLHSRGLGLAMANVAAKAHRGTLLLEPNKPHGLRARLVFPQQPGSEPVDL